jgi:UDP-N-acetylmuramoylalanine--D-glutamate ligase
MHSGFGDVALFGLGASTAAAAEYLAGRAEGAASSLTLYAGPSSPASAVKAAPLEARGVRVVWDTEQVEGSFDLGVVSPGIPCTSAFYQAAERACAELVSEPELAWRESPRDWVAVTGTNGKTTTTTLAAELLRAGGVASRAVGNIGVPPIAGVAGRPAGEVFVAELSSFQLHSSSHLAPRAAVLLNVTPDHLAWHGSLEAYAADKERVFANMGPRDLCLLGTDAACRAVAARLRARGLRVVVLGEEPACCAADAAWVAADGRLTVRLHGRDFALARSGEMALKGPHNLQNALAASALALEMGADAPRVAAALAAFAPLAHRIEPCGRVAGVDFYDDSKATNTDAVTVALAAFEPGRTVVLLGGHDKGTDLTDLARTVAARCKGAVVFGEAAERFGAALEAAGLPAGFELRRAAHLRDALDAARAVAAPGDAVLLSPACSSFDEFSGYAERGDAFKGWVGELAAAEAGA